MRLFHVKSLFNRLATRSYSSSNDLNIQYLKHSLSEYDKPEHLDYLAAKNPHVKALRRSAVLVPISVRQAKNARGHFVQQSFFTLSRRAQHLKTFKGIFIASKLYQKLCLNLVFSGQTCFLGGMCDGTDKDEVATAIREANEEAGMRGQDLTILAQLCPLITSNSVLITPVVAFFDNEQFTPSLNKDEVDMVFELPTDRFIKSEGHETKSVKLKGGTDEYFVHKFRDNVVMGGQEATVVETWGVTAMICIAVSTMLHSRAPSFSVDPKFEFRNDNVNEYLEFNLLANMERIRTAKKPRSE